MRFAGWVALIVGSLIFQSVFAPLFFGSGRLDMLLLIVVSTGLLYGKEAGIGVGIVAGILQDLAVGNILGLNLLTKMLIGFLAGLIEQKVFKDHILLPLLGALSAVLLQCVGQCLFMLMQGFTVSVSEALRYVLMPMLVVTTAAAVPMHALVRKLQIRMR